MKYGHYCNECQFLGEHEPKNKFDQNYSKIFDLYYCPKGIGCGFIVARYGNEPTQNIQCQILSLKERVNIFEVINEGYRRYKEKKQTISY